MAATRGPTTRRDVLTAGALGLLVAAGGAAAALLPAGTGGGSGEPAEEAASSEVPEPATVPEDDPAASIDRTEPIAGAAATRPPTADRRHVFPKSVVGRLPERVADRPTIRAWVVEEALEDPSGVHVTGPLEVTIDEDGCASVPVSGRVFRWWLQSGNAWRRGDETADAPDGAPEVKNAGRGPHGLVRVLDAVGRSVAGVEVTLQRAETQYRATLATVCTDADGLAIFPLPDEGATHRAPAPPANATCFRVEVPVVPPVTAPYSREGPWPAVIGLPPLGAIDVRIVASGDDEPAGHVGLAALAGGSQETGFVPWVRAPVARPGVRFPHIGTGMRFAATCRPDKSRITTRVEFDGPAGPGRTAKVDLPFGGLRHVFSGRLLAANGGPARAVGVQVSVPLRSAGSPWHACTMEWVSTDQDGRFEARLDADLSGVDAVEVTVSTGAQELLRRRVGRVAPGASVDFGDLRLVEGTTVPLLVGGRVLDPGGSSVCGLLVTAWSRRSETWEPVRGAQAFTSDDGAFEVRRDAGPAAEWQVRVSHSADGRVADPVPFSVGESGLSIRLRPTASVQVRVLLPPALEHGHGPALALQGEVAGASGRSDPAAGGDAFSSSHAGGYHVFGVLAGGTGRIVAFPPGLPDRILASKDVTVEPGVRNDAGTLDLRNVVPVRTVRVLGPDGKGAADGAVWWRTSDATEWSAWNAVTCRPDGTASIPGMTPMDLLARRTGSGFVEVSRVTADTTLTPPSAGKTSVVEVRIADGLDVPAPPLRFAVGLALVADVSKAGTYSTATDPRNAARPSAPLERETRSARFEVSDRGRHVVRLSLILERPDGNGSGVPVELEGEASADLAGDGSPRTFVLRWKPETLAAAMARLRED